MHNTQAVDFDRVITELKDVGFCILRAQLRSSLVNACREAFWPTLKRFLEVNADCPNRGQQRHFLPMPWDAGIRVDMADMAPCLNSPPEMERGWSGSFLISITQMVRHPTAD